MPPPEERLNRRVSKDAKRSRSANSDAVRDRERAEFCAAMKRPTFQEAVQSFMQKRQPDFHQQGMD